jgi:LysM repeat protein
VVDATAKGVARGGVDVDDAESEGVASSDAEGVGGPLGVGASTSEDVGSAEALTRSATQTTTRDWSGVSAVSSGESSRLGGDTSMVEATLDVVARLGIRSLRTGSGERGAPSQTCGGGHELVQGASTCALDQGAV